MIFSPLGVQLVLIPSITMKTMLPLRTLYMAYTNQKILMQIDMNILDNYNRQLINECEAQVILVSFFSWKAMSVIPTSPELSAVLSLAHTTPIVILIIKNRLEKYLQWTVFQCCACGHHFKCDGKPLIPDWCIGCINTRPVHRYCLIYCSKVECLANEDLSNDD